MAKRKLSMTKAAKAARSRRRKNKKKGHHVKYGCGKHKWGKGGQAYWKCKPGAKKHAYKR